MYVWGVIPARMPGCVDTRPAGGSITPGRQTTTGSLTTTTLIYTIGAGITAAAGTRLALQWVLYNNIDVGSFHIQDNIALHCYLLSLPPCTRIG